MTQSRVLVVHDEEDVRNRVAKMLHTPSRVVDAAATASRGLTMLRKRAYDLLIVGIRLPDGDGLELMRRARTITPAIETILLAVPDTTPLAADTVARGRHRGPAEGRATARAAPGDAGRIPVVSVPIGTPLEDVERLLIRETLRQTGGNKRRAAHLLGIATRTIYRKL